jgi:hypothetical protein
VGADVLNVAPNSAAEYDRGLGVPMGAAPLGGSQCEPVTTRHEEQRGEKRANFGGWAAMWANSDRVPV